MKHAGTILKPFRFFVRPLARAGYWVSARLLRHVYPELEPRAWSNQELSRFGHLFEGAVVNVSAWEDADKYGRRYRDYFPNSSSYHITNLGGGHGESEDEGEISLDLEEELPDKLRRRWDIVLNHTTLEHVFDVHKAFANLCLLSRDIVVVVVPWLQYLHWDDPSYKDYWRISPFALDRLFDENGFRMVYFSYNENPVYPVYVFSVGSRNPDKWQSKFPESPHLSTKGKYVGRSSHTHRPDWAPDKC